MQAKITMKKVTTIPLKSGRIQIPGNKPNDQNSIQGEIKNRLESGNACYHSVQNLLRCSLISKNVKMKIYRTIILPEDLYGYET